MNFADLVSSRCFTLGGEINVNSATELVKWLSRHDKEQPMTVTLMTFGGEVNAAMAIHDALKLASQSVEINVATLGMCQSAGNLVLTGVPRERRFASVNTRFMIHAASIKNGDKTTVCSPTSPDNIQELETLLGVPRLGEAQFLQETMIRILTESSSLTEPVVRKMLERDTYLTAEEALRCGLIGNILA